MPVARRKRLWPEATLKRGVVVGALGTAQALACGSSYYLPAILADPIADGLELSRTVVFGVFSGSLLVSAVLGPSVGRVIDTHGGRGELALANLVLAAGLVLLALTQGVVSLVAAWTVLGVGMAMGLYDPAFATLAGLYGRAARGPITGITLIAGFASTVGWPLSALLEAHFGWRGACLVWAALNLLIGLPLNRLLIPRAPPPIRPTEVQGTAGSAPRGAMLLLSFVFAATWFVTGAMASHLPRLLEIAGASATAAVAAAALVGPAQVGARLVEFGALKRTHPLISARLAAALHPIGAIVLMAIGSPGHHGLRHTAWGGERSVDHRQGHPAARDLRAGRLRIAQRGARRTGARRPSWRAADLRPAARPDGSRRARDFSRAQPCRVARVAHAESASGAGACVRGVGRDPFALLNLWSHW